MHKWSAGRDQLTLKVVCIYAQQRTLFYLLLQTERQLDCALDLMRRLPPQQIEKNLSDLIDLVSTVNVRCRVFCFNFEDELRFIVVYVFQYVLYVKCAFEKFILG